MLCFFVTDLHGSRRQCELLAERLVAEEPAALFLGGDLFPGFGGAGELAEGDFLDDCLRPLFRGVRQTMGPRTPEVFVIMGNDDPKSRQDSLMEGSNEGLWSYLDGTGASWGKRMVFGYPYIPPTPFWFKDWERYDVSRYVDPGCVSPEEGRRSVSLSPQEAKWATIKGDLEAMVGDRELGDDIFLFHVPPYNTHLDHAALDGQMVDHVPVDPHIGSIAVERFIRSRQPLLTFHGHVHEAHRLTGVWKQRLGVTVAINGAHDGPELCLIRFDPNHPWEAERTLIS